MYSENEEGVDLSCNNVKLLCLHNFVIILFISLQYHDNNTHCMDYADHNQPNCGE